MQLTVKELIEHNNEKRKKLTPENHEYYEDMLVYIRTNALKSERATEEVLLEMLDHLLEAQSKGKTAEDVFGKMPKELAKEIIETLPKEPYKATLDYIFELGFTLFGWYLVISGIPPLISQEEQTIYLGTLLLSGILSIASMVVLIYFVFGVLKSSAFENKSKKNMVNWLLGTLFVVFFAGGIGTNVILEPFGATFTVSYLLAFGLGCFFLLAAYLLKKSRESK